MQKNDLFAAKCTMNSMSRDSNTYFGFRHVDEMCNFILMYYTDYKDKLEDFNCSSYSPDNSNASLSKLKNRIKFLNFIIFMCDLKYLFRSRVAK